MLSMLTELLLMYQGISGVRRRRGIDVCERTLVVR